jgi:uncharacterized protein YkwD
MRRGLVAAGRALCVSVAVALVLGALGPPARAAWTPRRDMVAWMNAARGNHGTVHLQRGWRLRALADEHSRRMAIAGRIFHTTSLGSKLRFVSWRAAGENVGVGGSMRQLYEAFMKSTPHRANILGRAYRRVGIGVHRADGFLWVTMIFVG